jgi:hypothetical protein
MVASLTLRRLGHHRLLPSEPKPTSGKVLEHLQPFDFPHTSAFIFSPSVSYSLGYFLSATLAFLLACVAPLSRLKGCTLSRGAKELRNSAQDGRSLKNPKGWLPQTLPIPRLSKGLKAASFRRRVSVQIPRREDLTGFATYQFVELASRLRRVAVSPRNERLATLIEHISERQNSDVGAVLGSFDYSH